MLIKQNKFQFGKQNCNYKNSITSSQRKRFQLLNTPSKFNVFSNFRSFCTKTRTLPDDGLNLSHFLQQDTKHTHETNETQAPIPYITEDPQPGLGRKFFVETYGCQMNFSDTEIVYSILKKSGFENANDVDEADIILLNTCAIRDHAESKIWKRLEELRAIKKKNKKKYSVGVLGCMAERLKEEFLDQKNLCDLVVGPDSYRDLPRLLSKVDDGEKAINVMLSVDETYADISPVRVDENNLSAYVSIMRGCNNMCSYCIVPFTRGRERSRQVDSILDEVRDLSDRGFKEIILLGQNVNSYNDISTPSNLHVPLADGFKSIVKIKQGGTRFPELLDKVSKINPEIRIRFTSPHPKDFPDEALYLINERVNICKSLHMPAQSGSTRVLELMRRGYSRESYLNLVNKVREIIPGCAISSDFIAGFCGETEEDHQETISLMKLVEYEMAFMFAYSLREKTHAHRHLVDDVPTDVKGRRLREIIDLFYSTIEKKNEIELGNKHVVLIEGLSRKNSSQFFGRTDTNKKVIIPVEDVPVSLKSNDKNNKTQPKAGDYIAVEITGTGFTLKGKGLGITTLQEFSSTYPNN